MSLTYCESKKHKHNSFFVLPLSQEYCTIICHWYAAKKPSHSRNTRSFSHTILLDRPAHSRASLSDRSLYFAFYSIEIAFQMMSGVPHHCHDLSLGWRHTFFFALQRLNFLFDHHIGRLARMSIFDTEVDGSNPGSSMLFPWARHFIRIASVDSAVKWVPGWDNLVKDVQCYELFVGIALKNHAFSFFIFSCTYMHSWYVIDFFHFFLNKQCSHVYKEIKFLQSTCCLLTIMLLYVMLVYIAFDVLVVIIYAMLFVSISCRYLHTICLFQSLLCIMYRVF